MVPVLLLVNELEVLLIELLVVAPVPVHVMLPLLIIEPLPPVLLVMAEQDTIAPTPFVNVFVPLFKVIEPVVTKLTLFTVVAVLPPVKPEQVKVPLFVKLALEPSVIAPQSRYDPTPTVVKVLLILKVVALIVP